MFCRLADLALRYREAQAMMVLDRVVASMVQRYAKTREVTTRAGQRPAFCEHSEFRVDSYVIRGGRRNDADSSDTEEEGDAYSEMEDTESDPYSEEEEEE